MVQTAYQKCLLISTSEQNFMKLSIQVTYDVRALNVPNFDSMEVQEHTELNKVAISKATSLNKLYR